jgi:hypothetical protein
METRKDNIEKPNDKLFLKHFPCNFTPNRLLIKASGQGEYWGEYEGVRCKVYFKANPYQKEDDDRTFLTVEQVKMDFSVKDITMGVENDNNNRVIRKFIQ